MNDERRRFYRIDDDLCLSCEQIDSAGVDRRLDDFWQNEHVYSLRNNYNFQIEQNIADFNKIEKQMPELARYLVVLQQQIDRITEKLIDDDYESSLSHRQCNVSAQGISFYAETAPAPKSLVELNLKLLPSGLRLVIIARVVLVETGCDHPQGTEKVSLDFEYVHEADREILIKHIHGKQMESLSSAQES